MSEPSLIQDIGAKLEIWQTGLGALIGLVSLAIVAWYNFHLNRRRDQEQRQAEARSVAAAIYSEIILLRGQLALLAKIVAKFDQDGREFSDLRADVYRPSEPVIFPCLAGKLGQLDPDLVIGISKFFSDLEEASRGLDVLTTPGEGPKFACTIVLRPAVSGVHDVRRILEKIQEMFRMEEVEEPDIGTAEIVIELWENRFESQSR